MIRVGPRLAVGRTSDVYAYGEGSVVKIPRPNVPPHWAGMEARFTDAVRAVGAPAPEVRGLVRLEGRESIVFERIDGESMWSRLLRTPDDVTRVAEEFATIHRRVLATGLPVGVDALVDRMCVKIGEALQIEWGERTEAQRIVRSMPSGAALLHGDFHPSNILISGGEPVVIDWFDTAIGHPVADVVRSSLLIRPSQTNPPPHLPQATHSLLSRFHASYVAAVADVLDLEPELLRRWEAVVAVSRLTEDAQSDASTLIGLWRNRDAVSSPLLETLSHTRRIGDQLAQ